MTDPSDMVLPLLTWYQSAARPLPWRQDGSPYAVWVSEIMLQQTRVEAVKPYYARFMQALPDIPALATCSDEALYKLWQGLGYYRRAAGLKACAKVLVSQYHGRLPKSYDALLNLPGIGAYTAGAIASIAFSVPVPAVDGNVLRVMSRLNAYSQDITAPAAKRHFFDLLRDVIPVSSPGAFNQALMELGATICLPHGEPKCQACPVAALCEAKANGCPTAYPVRPPKKPRQQQDHTMFLLTLKDRLCLVPPKQEGLLGGLYALPSLSGHLSQEEAESAIHSWHLTAKSLSPLPACHHIFTHIRWDMTGYAGQVDGEPPKDWVLASKAQLQNRYALPSAYRRYVNLWKPE